MQDLLSNASGELRGICVTSSDPSAQD